MGRKKKIQLVEKKEPSKSLPNYEFEKRKWDAYNDLIKGESYRKAASQHNISYRCLFDYARGKRNRVESHEQYMALPVELETQLSNQISAMIASTGTFPQQKVISQLANSLINENGGGNSGGKPAVSDTWVSKFLRRHPELNYEKRTKRRKSDKSPEKQKKPEEDENIQQQQQQQQSLTNQSNSNSNNNNNSITLPVPNLFQYQQNSLKPSLFQSSTSSSFTSFNNSNNNNNNNYTTSSYIPPSTTSSSSSSSSPPPPPYISYSPINNNNNLPQITDFNTKVTIPRLKIHLEHWFDGLNKVIDTLDLQPQNIYNASILYFSVSNDTNNKYIISRLPLKPSLDNNRTTFSIIECISTDGTFLKPVVLGDSKNSLYNVRDESFDYLKHSEYLQQQPLEDNNNKQQQQSDLGLLWLQQYFYPHCSQNNNDWKLLIVEESNLLTIEFFQWAFNHKILIIVAGWIARHAIQPIDCGIMPTFYHNLVEKLSNNYNNNIEQQDVIENDNNNINNKKRKFEEDQPETSDNNSDDDDDDNSSASTSPKLQHLVTSFSPKSPSRSSPSSSSHKKQQQQTEITHILTKFLKTYQQAHDQSFNSLSIISGWRETGIIPRNSYGVLSTLEQKNNQIPNFYIIGNNDKLEQQQEYISSEIVSSSSSSSSSSLINNNKIGNLDLDENLVNQVISYLHPFVYKNDVIIDLLLSKLLSNSNI